VVSSCNGRINAPQPIISSISRFTNQMQDGNVIPFCSVPFRQSIYWCTVSEPSGLSKPNQTGHFRTELPVTQPLRDYYPFHVLKKSLMTDLQKRGPGRPKGTRNKPGAKAGRPRKDIQNVQRKEGHSRTGNLNLSFFAHPCCLSFSHLL
jgi:hypothetical protein